MPRPRPVPADPNVVTLRLTQNAFVRGTLALAGDTFHFSKPEAEKRLRTTQLWERL